MEPKKITLADTFADFFGEYEDDPFENVKVPDEPKPAQPKFDDRDLMAAEMD